MKSSLRRSTTFVFSLAVLVNACGELPTAAADRQRVAGVRLAPLFSTGDTCVTVGVCTLDGLDVWAPPLPPPAEKELCPVSPYGESMCPPPPGNGGSGPVGTPDALAEGPLTWAACIGAGLVAAGGAVLTYSAYEDYHQAVQTYARAEGLARVTYRYGTAAEYADAYEKLVAATAVLQRKTRDLAANTGLTVGGFLAIVALCSPSVLFPTP